MIDQALGDNDRLKILALAILAAHVTILIAVLILRRIVSAMLALNLALAIVVVLYKIGAYPQLWANLVGGSSPEVAALVAFELAVATAAVAALDRVRFARAISAAAFGLHLLASVAALSHMMTLKFDRLV